MKRSRDLECVEFNRHIWNKMTKEKIKLVLNYCDNALKDTIMNKGDSLSCIFCNIEKERIKAENEAAYAIYDGFPVSKGHMLIIPKKTFQ